MKILSIGNSFSQDATRYLHQIANADGVELNCVNLYIGGCSLERHYKNITGDLAEYALEINGESAERQVSVKEGLLLDNFDVVTLQQVSNGAPNYETFQPYLNELSAYVKKYAPNAKQVIHQTWAYEEGSARLCEELGYAHHQDMFYDVKNSYEKAKKEINAYGIIESGQLFQNLIQNGIEKVHRDTFHASFGLGRYALGLLWYRVLTGNSVENNSFCDFDEPIPEKEIEIAKKTVMLF